MTVRASVVVPTYKRPDLLHRCLGALMAQDLEPSAWEVIVADDAASPDTQRLVSKWAELAKPVLRYVPVSGPHGPAAARNVGWRSARGEIIAFTDDDTVPDPAWLRQGVAALEAGADAAWGRIRMPLPERPTDYERNEAGLEHAEFATANCFCRRSALDALGGFDERFGMAWREDADLYFSLLEAGYRVMYAPQALVVHPVRPARWGVSLGQQRKAQFNALLYKKHPSLYREKIQRQPPWHYYGCAAGVLTTAVGLAVGLPVLTVAGAGSWLLLTGRFCQRRLRGTTQTPRHIAEMVVTSAAIPLLSIYWRLRGALRFRVLFL
ncbi:MAG TPA: glycosyltransferase [Gemmataceae bacterium]|nr:glycosyltransferase [Gemmataceae bacterium]